MPQSWIPRLLNDLASARRSWRPSRKPARRTVRSTLERLEERDLLSASPVLSASVLSAPPFSPNGDGVQDTSTIQVRFAGATPNATQVGVAVENQAGQVVYQAPQVAATSATGTLGFAWDGKDAHGKVVADGTYTVMPVLNGNLFINPAAILVDTAVTSASPAAPADQSFARGTVPLSVTASDPDGIARVDFYIDESATPVGHGTYSAATQTWNFSLNTTSHTNPLADGNHTWYARAFDNAGNSGVSAARTLRVDNARPQVNVTNPGLGILGETHYTITGSATDQPALAGYGVAGVQVTVTRASDGTVLSSGPATVTAAGAGKYTWSYAYTPAEAGLEVVTARATDMAGNTGGDRASFVVDNRPVVTLPAGATANEGAVLTASGSFADPGSNPLARWTATVNYGDGTATQRLALNADKTFSLAHAYADSGSYTVTVRVTDKYGVTGTATLAATVANVAPGNLTLTPTPAVIKENGTTTLAGTFADPGTKDAHTVTIHWGDGSPDTTLPLRPGVLTFHAQHPYPSAGTDSVTVTVSDGDGGTVSGSATVVVNNVAPVPHVHIDPHSLPAHEGAPVTLGSTVTDPGPQDNFTYQWSITRDGKPVPVPAGVKADGPAFTFVPPDEGHYVVTLQVTDSNGAAGSTSVGINVSDTPPALTLSGSGKVNEGSPYTLTLGAITDSAPGGVTRTTIHWGDGTTTVFDAAHPLPAGGAVPHTYANGPASDTIAVDVQDEDGTHPAVANQTVTVADVAPSDTTIQLDHTTLAEGGTATLSGSFTDPGTLDTHAVTINWGDGSAPTVLNLAAGVVTFNASHPYPASGTDSVTVTVTGEGGVSDSTSATVTVNNVAPSGTKLQLNHGTINEGDTATLAGSFTDPSTVDGHTVTIDWGDGSAPDTLTLMAGATTFNKDHHYLDNRPGNAPYTITAHVVDTGDGGADQATAQVTVLNVAPTPVITGAPASIPEGGTITLGSTVTDPGPLDTNPTYAWTVTKNGSPFASGTAAGLTFTPDDDGTYVATLAVTDKDGAVGTVSKTIQVTDVAPTAQITGPSVGLAGQTLSFQGDFQDPGPLDSKNETFAWQVTDRTGQVVQSGNQQNFQVALTTPGSYVVSFRVTNPDGDTKLVAKSLSIVPPDPVLGPGTSNQGTSGGVSAQGPTAQGDPVTPALAAAPSFQNTDWGRLF
jgi:hypothetical protein